MIRTRRPVLAGMLALLVAGGGGRLAAADAAVRSLTNAAQVRALSLEAASEGQPVQLRGVVLFEGPDSLVLADATAGIYLRATNRELAGFQMGDLLAVTGKTDPGKFAPIVKVETVEKIGRGDIPQPQRVAFPDLQMGRLDAQWIEVTGVVRRSEASTEDETAWGVWIEVGGGRLPVRLPVEQGKLLAVDSEVRMRGVCFYQFNKARQAVSPLLQIPRGEPVIVTRPAPEHPFEAIERPVSSLLQFSPEDFFSHRVRVSGVVTHAVMGEGFWIRSGPVGLRVRSLQSQLLAVGDQVTVLGFLSRGEYSPVLEDAIFRKLAKTQRPEPLPLSSPNEALDHDQDLVQLEANLVEQWRVPDGCRITLQTEDKRFVAWLRLEGHQEVPRTWMTGSRVRVVGICSVTAGAKEGTAAGTVDPGSFQILMRSPSDMTVLRSPSWWTAEHVGWVTASVMGLLLTIGGLLFWMHRRRVARQMAEMKAQAALDAERTRIARDLHDEIGANLTHISILSTLASQAIKAQPESAQQHNTEAATVAQQTIRAFDEILWSVNPKNDTLVSLSHYLCRYAEEMLAPAGIVQHFVLPESYPNRLVPPHARHGFLLAVKEVLHNVIKHSRARKVEIQCTVESDQAFVVQIKDDGCGMILPRPAAAISEREGLGLQNLHRRLKELGGECVLESTPGQGTRVRLRLPL